MNKTKKMKKNVILDLFLTFVKIGFFTVGGGYAMISIIEDNCVEKKKWITHEEMMNLTVVAESTPGPIAINCSTYVGFRQAKLAGALAATLGVILPSFLCIFLIAMFLDNFLEIKIIANAFKGIKIAVGLLIVDAAVRMLRKSEKDRFSIIVTAASCAAMLAINVFAWNFSSLRLMLIAGALGIFAEIFRKARGGDEAE